MTHTIRKAAAFTLALAGAVSAHAADGWHPVIGASVSGGGDTLVTVVYTNGETQDIKAGGLIQLYGGAEYQSDNFALQTTLGYHVDTTNASNATVKFSRLPIEVLGLWTVGEQYRVGGGLRQSTSAKLSGSGAASGLGSHSLDARLGLVLQAELLLGSGQASAYLRYVAETYTVSGSNVNGNHVGLGLSYRF